MNFRVAIPHWLAITFSVFCTDTANANSCQDGNFPSSISDTCLPPYPGEEIDAFEKPMSFTMRQVSIRPETTWIAAEGVITKDTPDEFRRFLENNIVYRENRVEFNSPGGNLYAAMELGRIIRRFGNDTTLGRSITLDNPEFSMDVLQLDDAVCLSACAYAFLGGQRRYFSDEDRLGVHRFGNADYEISVNEAQGATSDIARYIEEMGADQRLLQIASRTAFEDEIFIVNNRTALELGIIFDPNNRNSRFEVSLLGGNVVANTTIFHQGFEYAARLHCIDGFPRLVVWGPKEQVPLVFHSLNDAVARFESNGMEFSVIADGGVLRNGNAYATFSGFDLSQALISSGSLHLDMVWPRNWETMEFVDRIRWTDMATWFSFSLNVENANETVPIILRECQ